MRIEVTLDCPDPARAAAFWGPALGYEQRGSLGATYLSLAPPPGDPRPPLVLQRVPEAKSTKLGMHLDLYVDDLDGEVARLEALGARRVPGGDVAEEDERWVVLTDPDGNEFCVCSRPDDGSG